MKTVSALAWTLSPWGPEFRAGRASWLCLVELPLSLGSEDQTALYPQHCPGPGEGKDRLPGLCLARGGGWEAAKTVVW